jgi:hypothetical protein
MSAENPYPAVKCQFCRRERDGAHYNIWNISSGGVDGLRRVFPDAKANEMNFVLFSTSGVHGTYTTIEEIEASIAKYGDSPQFPEDESPDDYCYPEITVTVYHPRIIGVGYGCVKVEAKDIQFLKDLRQSSWEAVSKIGREEGR